MKTQGVISVTGQKRLPSGLQESVNVHHWCSIVGATVTVHQFFCIFHFEQNLGVVQTLRQQIIPWYLRKSAMHDTYFLRKTLTFTFYLDPTLVGLGL